MGREIKRVPLDFDWPINEVWKGFINPHYKPCPENEKTCFNGYTAAGKWLQTIVQLIMIAGEDGAHPRRRGIWPHPYLQSLQNAPRHGEGDLVAMLSRRGQIIAPTEELAQLSGGIAGRPPRPPLGHHGCDAWTGYTKIREAAGLPESWGTCQVCKGESTDPEVRERYEAWKPEQPPTGPGWQVWETVSEGSPISPVFATPEELIEWLVRDGYSRTAAESFVSSGWVPSGVIVDGKMYKDIETAAILKE